MSYPPTFEVEHDLDDPTEHDPMPSDDVEGTADGVPIVSTDGSELLPGGE